MADSILLIDDDADLLTALGDYFDRLGYEVGRAATGALGLETFERLRPEVVILDLHLPTAGGLDLLERLRAQGGAVILLTPQDDSATAVRAMQLGAEHCLTKPVDLTHLAAAAARVGEKVRLGRENQRLRAGGGADGAGERRHAPQTLAEVERRQIEKSLRFHAGNRTRSAQELGISRATLINKIKAYGLTI
jgi:DNA-binding NtrC family response regulator